jgi:hypothetical protein
VRDLVKSRVPKAEKWILLGIPALILIGFPMHYLYEWSGKLTIAGIFLPVNESIWEHLKLALWPMILWWFLWYIINEKKYAVSREKWIPSATAAVVTYLLVLLAFHYTYKGVFGFESLALDIFSFILGIILGQLLGLHIYIHSDFRISVTYIASAVLILVIAAFTLFTFAPPHIPLFKDMPTGTYGIQ